MFCSVQSMGLSGIESYPVTVEVDCRRGLPRFDIVGLPDTAVKESRERVHSAIGNLGYTFPAGVLVVNLAPADTKKSGPLYDLPILLGILAAGCGVDLPLAGSAFVGEISLDGRLRPVNGVLSMVSEAARPKCASSACSARTPRCGSSPSAATPAARSRTASRWPWSKTPRSPAS